MDFPLDSFNFDFADLILSQIFLLHVLEGFFDFLVVHVSLVDLFIHVLDVWFDLANHSLGTTFKKTLEVLIFD
jgi:hypothetical protein